MKKTASIPLPCRPSKRLSGEVKKVTRICRTFGGGMGGGNAKHFGHIEKEDSQYIHFFDIILGKTIRINPAFVTVIEDDVSIAIQVVDTTEHANFRQFTTPKQKVTYWYVIHNNATAKFIDSLAPKGTENSTLIHSEVLED